ncbi:MAG: TetR family transcriptional regulator C-terminal domain-containing protein [Desulfobacterales bacterium]|nr:MAG: TetR family transcriptional regulator C-terminal domain-containing protein [Desulfobacterales bacterium]
MKQDTKQKIIEAGARIIHRKGYNHTGIQEVLKAAGVPKGSFYFYFSNKEDFGLQVIDFFNQMFTEMVDPLINEYSQSPLRRLEQLFDRFISLFQSFNYACGCPIGNLAQEMGDLSPAFSRKLKDSIDLMIRLYEGLLKAAQAAGEISAELDPRKTASFIVSSWHGALIRMKIVKGPEPLENHKQFILSALLNRIH